MPGLWLAQEFSLWLRRILAADFLGPHVLLAHTRVCVGVSCIPRGSATCAGREARANNRNDSSLTPAALRGTVPRRTPNPGAVRGWIALSLRRGSLENAGRGI